MRSLKKVGILILKGGEQLEVTSDEAQKLMQSKIKSGLGAIYFRSVDRMIEKPHIVDIKTKWVEDKQQAIVEERPGHLIAEKEKIVSDGTGPGYKKFMEMRNRLNRKSGLVPGIDPSLYNKK